MEDRIFKERFFELVEYYTEHEDFDVPKIRGPLGQWVHSLQQAPSSLPIKHKKMLQAIGFNHFSNDDNPIEKNYFKQCVYDLVVYRATHGDCKVPADHSRLAGWVETMRARYRKRDLPEPRIKLLESLGFEWGRTTPVRRAPAASPERRTTAREEKSTKEVAYAEDLDRRWQQRFEELIVYKEQHGHTNVPQYKGQLGRWVKAQREQKKQTDLTNAGAGFPPRKKLPACLSSDRIAKLMSIGFQFKVKTMVGWDLRYQQLLEYRKKYGDVHVPQAFTPDIAFGQWVMKQRVQYQLLKKGKKSSMNEERIAKLEAIGFAWVAPGFQLKGLGKRKRTNDEAESSSDEEAEPPAAQMPYYHASPRTIGTHALSTYERLRRDGLFYS